MDHIKRVESEDDPLFYDESNLQALCKRCHSRKTAKEDGAFGNKKKDY
ncbi:HNH endonuclease [Brachyspira pilosicoli]|nr:HNH endonuclease signature motif containing protein [Brachyspira pilosicoli]WIH86292.1 HNH endonuclease [Brachyspira pilosicoli]